MGKAELARRMSSSYCLVACQSPSAGSPSVAKSLFVTGALCDWERESDLRGATTIRFRLALAGGVETSCCWWPLRTVSAQRTNRESSMASRHESNRYILLGYGVACGLLGCTRAWRKTCKTKLVQATNLLQRTQSAKPSTARQGLPGDADRAGLALPAS